MKNVFSKFGKFFKKGEYCNKIFPFYFYFSKFGKISNKKNIVPKCIYIPSSMDPMAVKT
jgi:hypothetical protein